MSVISSDGTLIIRVERHVKTGATTDRALVSAVRTGWDTTIDRLLAWWEEPSLAGDDDGFEPPSRESIHVALQLARAYRDNFLSPPLRVVPDGEGGVAFERRSGNLFESLRVAADGRAELLAFENSRLVLREPQQ